MKKIYLAVAALFLISVLLFIAAFIYLDKEKRKTSYYIVNLDGYDIGTIKIEKFVTEDKLIYKSSSSIPFSPLLTDSKSRITLDRRYNLESYSKENSGKGAGEIIYLENKDDIVSFVATFDSKFSSLSFPLIIQKPMANFMLLPCPTNSTLRNYTKRSEKIPHLTLKYSGRGK